MARRKVLKQFTRNIGGQIVTGDPKHPKEHGRFLTLSEEVAEQLAEEGLVGDEDTTEKMSGGDKKARRRHDSDSLLGMAEEGEGKGVGGGDTGTSSGNPDGARTDDAGPRNSSQTVREHRTAGKAVSDDQKEAGAKQVGGRGRGRRGGAKDSTTTEATTNHPGESGPQTPPAKIPGNATPAEGDDDPDRAPASGSEG